MLTRGICFCLLLWPASVLAQLQVQGLVLYDDFQENVIDPNKWAGAQGYDPDLRESVRRIESGSEQGLRALHLLHRAYSATNDDNGTDGGGFGLSFINPTSITTISFGLTVDNIISTGCATNPSALDVTDAEFRGSFFNINSSPTDSSGDVQANISIARNPEDLCSSLDLCK